MTDVRHDAPALVRPSAAAPSEAVGGRRHMVEVLTWVAVAGAVLAIGTVLWVALRRIGSPAELEWMEGGMVDLSRRAMSGRSLYGPPSLELTPYLYTPLTYYVGGLVGLVTGEGFLPLRLVSLGATLACFGAVAALVRGEGRDRRAAFVAAGVFAACYSAVGFWFDLARVDMLFLALVLWAAVVARRTRGTSGAVGAGALMVLAVLAKQEALLPALALLPWCWRTGRRVAATYAATLVLLGGAAAAALQWWSDGWFSYYVVDLPRSHEWITEMWWTFWSRDLSAWWPTSLAVVLVLTAGAASARGRAAGESVRWFLLPLTVAMVVTAWLARLHSGGFDNVLLPAVAMGAVWTGWTLAAARSGVGGDGPNSPSAVGVRTGWWPVAVAALVVVQLVVLWRPPSGQVPDAAHDRAARALVEELRGIDGPVYLPGHGWYVAAAGRGDLAAQGAAISDVLRGPTGPARDGLRAELERAVRTQRFAAIVVDSHRAFSFLPTDVGRYYRPERRLVLRPDALEPVTGTRTGPAELWVPRSDRPAAAGTARFGRGAGRS